MAYYDAGSASKLPYFSLGRLTEDNLALHNFDYALSVEQELSGQFAERRDITNQEMFWRRLPHTTFVACDVCCSRWPISQSSHYWRYRTCWAHRPEGCVTESAVMQQNECGPRSCDYWAIWNENILRFQFDQHGLGQDARSAPLTTTAEEFAYYHPSPGDEPFNGVKGRRRLDLFFEFRDAMEEGSRRFSDIANLVTYGRGAWFDQHRDDNLETQSEDPSNNLIAYTRMLENLEDWEYDSPVQTSWRRRFRRSYWAMAGNAGPFPEQKRRVFHRHEAWMSGRCA